MGNANRANLSDIRKMADDRNVPAGVINDLEDIKYAPDGNMVEYDAFFLSEETDCVRCPYATPDELKRSLVGAIRMHLPRTCVLHQDDVEVSPIDYVEYQDMFYVQITCFHEDCENNCIDFELCAHLVEKTWNLVLDEHT